MVPSGPSSTTGIVEAIITAANEHGGSGCFQREVRAGNEKPLIAKLAHQLSLPQKNEIAVEEGHRMIHPVAAFRML
jgi:hypothetical protein